MDKMICDACGKGIREFKIRKDWQGRKLHLKCWKEKEDELLFKILFENIKKVV